MRRRTLGPLRVDGGINLDAPRARAGQVVSALNMEQRGGHAQTRLGCTTLGLTQLVGSAQFGGAVHPADWTGLEVVYVGIDFTDYNASASIIGTGIVDPDDFFLLSFFGFDIRTPLPEQITFEFWGDDDAWHGMTVDLFDARSDPAGLFPKSWSPTGSFNDRGALIVRRPHGWKRGTPTGLPGSLADFWVIRITRPAGDPWSGDGPSDLLLAKPLDITQDVDLVSFRSRTSWDTYAVAVDIPALGGRAARVYNVAEKNGSFPGRCKIVDETDSFAMDPDAGERMRSAYIPATNNLLFWCSPEYFVFDPETGTFVEEDGLPKGVLKANATGEDTAWEDVPLETSFPRSSALAVYGGRVFIAEDGNALVRWTAPDEFWRILPSGNQYRLGGRGAGSVRAMEELQGTLYLFCDQGIYSANAGDPVPGQDSAFFFSFLDDSTCASARSVVIAEDGIIYLANDGVRVWNGQSSRVISQPVEDLFQSDSEHPLACLRPWTAAGVWDARRRQYRLHYSSAASKENDVCLVIDFEVGGCWIWSSRFAGDIAQRRTGVLGQRVTYRPDLGLELTVDRAGIVRRIGEGITDSDSPIEWDLETPPLNVGDNTPRAVTREVIVNEKRSATGPIRVGAIADGWREDVRNVSVQTDGQAGQLGNIVLGTTALNRDQLAYAPSSWRGSLRGRTFAAKVENAEPPRPVAIHSLTLKIEEG